MKKNNVFTKVVIAVLTLGLVVGVICNSVLSSKANSSSEVICTETFADNSERIADMSEEEFYEIFDNEQYAEEFDYTYNRGVTRDGASSELAIKLLVSLTSDQVNELVDNIYNKLPGFVKKFIGRDKINEVVVELVDYLRNNQGVQDKVNEFVDYISEKTKISKSIIKVVVEFVLEYVQEVFDEDINPTIVPTVEPTVEPVLEPTVNPTEEPSIVPTEEPTIEPVVAE